MKLKSSLLLIGITISVAFFQILDAAPLASPERIDVIGPASSGPAIICGENRADIIQPPPGSGYMTGFSINDSGAMTITTDSKAFLVSPSGVVTELSGLAGATITLQNDGSMLVKMAPILNAGSHHFYRSASGVLTDLQSNITSVVGTSFRIVASNERYWVGEYESGAYRSFIVSLPPSAPNVRVVPLPTGANSMRFAGLADGGQSDTVYYHVQFGLGVFRKYKMDAGTLVNSIFDSPIGEITAVNGKGDVVGSMSPAGVYLQTNGSATASQILIGGSPLQQGTAFSLNSCGEAVGFYSPNLQGTSAFISRGLSATKLEAVFEGQRKTFTNASKINAHGVILAYQETNTFPNGLVRTYYKITPNCHSCPQ